MFFFFFSSRRRHTRWPRDWSSDVCSSDLDHFIIHEREDGNRLLRLNNEETSGGSGFHSQINTPSTVVYGEWEFSIEVPHTTTQNYVYIYLISDLNQSYTGDTVPEGEISGYAVYTGNKKFELRRIDNGSGVSLTSVPSEIVVGQLYHVRVTRSEDNEWQLQVRSAGDEQRSEEHTSELQSRGHLVCRLLLEKKNKTTDII